VSLFRTENLVKEYAERSGEATVTVLKGIDLQISEGSITGIVGASGSGKSTLLHLLGGLDQPTSGEIYYRNENLANYTEKQRNHFRNSQIGFVFQFHHLLPEFTALENVMLPGLISNESAEVISQRATQLLTQFGLEHRLQHRPSMLSGGEQQRVAMARALINNPAILLADEPTGNLDEANTRQLIDLIISLNAQQNLTILLITHDQSIAARCDRVLHIQDGLISTTT
jgi:lipoprotein-releasing system ATP-binding protein